MANEIIAAITNQTFVRKLGRTFTVPNAQSLGAPALVNDIGSADWTSELRTGSEDTTMDFDKRQLSPHPLARRIKVSNTLLRMSNLNPEVFIRDRMAQMTGTVLENAYLNGTGANQPLGLFTSSANGINTDRDTTTATSTQIKMDDILNLEYSLLPQYRAGASFIFSRTVERELRKLKDGEGRPLWSRAYAEPGPLTLLGYPCYISEYAPSTISSGQYVMLLGDFRYYWMVDSMALQFQVLKELYAETNQSGIICRIESDGMPVLSSAFARLRMAT